MARFDEIARQHPNSAQLHCARGAGYQAAGNYSSALADFRRAIELAPNFAEAHYNLGTALRCLDQDLEAIAAYERAAHQSEDGGGLVESRQYLARTGPPR